MGSIGRTLRLEIGSVGDRGSVVLNGTSFSVLPSSSLEGRLLSSVVVVVVRLGSSSFLLFSLLSKSGSVSSKSKKESSSSDSVSVSTTRWGSDVVVMVACLQNLRKFRASMKGKDSTEVKPERVFCCEVRLSFGFYRDSKVNELNKISVFQRERERGGFNFSLRLMALE
ncbi:hypothetical protein V8G54_029857 [Vigna mungo]|uniref:Uncharacterized protein n=1 Tax=Vigna mungo TaxID=3915 RepID=A0AAQ3RKQ6_VIGMU